MHGTTNHNWSLADKPVMTIGAQRRASAHRRKANNTLDQTVFRSLQHPDFKALKALAEKDPRLDAIGTSTRGRTNRSNDLLAVSFENFKVTSKKRPSPGKARK